MAKIKLNNVRLSFPSLFRKAEFQGNAGKYEATFLLNKKTHADTIAEIEKQIEQGVKDNFKGKKIPADKLCMKDGDEFDYDGYAGHMSFKASNNKRPLVIDKDKTPVTEDDERVYAGCYVNAVVELWYQDNQFGRRVNANLLGVQFYKDGEAFGDGVTASEDDFDAFDDDGSDDDGSDLV
tara:strand:+ start:659 stop:1198 length:540 start_codon:yes stop_codon:yes gene_type:complete